MSSSRRIEVVESGRGFAAVYVFLSHIVLIGKIGENFPGANYLARLLGFGHQAVLLFFLLSGFSIHWTSMSRNLGGWRERLNYYYLRMRRIYPLFIVAVLITLGLLEIARHMGLPYSTSPDHQPNRLQILATLTFLTDYPWGGQWFNVLPTNAPLWSLSYEVVYYALYPMFWQLSRRFGIGLVVPVSILLSGLFVFLPLLWRPNHLTNVMSMYWLWCVGALIAEWHKKVVQLHISKLAYNGALMAAFILTVFGERLPLRFIADWLWGGLLAAIMISYRVNFAFRPSGWLGPMLVFTLLAIGCLCAYAFPVAGSRGFIVLRLILFASLLFATWIPLRFFELRHLISAVLSIFRRFGPCSYGLYVVHMPILIFIGATLQFYQLSNVWLWLLVSSPLVILMAQALETGLQPRIAFYLDRASRQFLPNSVHLNESGR